MKKFAHSNLPILLCIAAVMVLVYGRIQTVDLTEGQALVEGYQYWVTGMTLLASSIASSIH